MPAGGTGSSGRSRCAAPTSSTTSSSGTHSPTTSCKGTGYSPPPRSPDDRNIVRNSAYRLSVDRKQATTLSCHPSNQARDATIASCALSLRATIAAPTDLALGSAAESGILHTLIGGVSGRASARLAVVTANARSLPALICSIEAVVVPNTTC